MYSLTWLMLQEMWSGQTYWDKWKHSIYHKLQKVVNIMRFRTIKIKPYTIPVLLVALAGIILLAVFTTGKTIGDALVSASARKLPVYAVDNEGSGDIALTINCAWGADDITDILKILEKYNIKCTFFVLGVWVEKNPEALKAIVDQGHEVGNHSYSHRLPSQSDEKQIEDEIKKCSEVVYSRTGVNPQVYRAPSGDYNNSTIEIAEKYGMTAVQWSVDSIDWLKDRSAAEIINRVTGKTVSGSIILFHNDTNHTVEVLPEIIEHLQNENYTFVKVSELLLPGSTYIDNQGVQHIKKQ